MSTGGKRQRARQHGGGNNGAGSMTMAKGMSDGGGHRCAVAEAAAWVGQRKEPCM